MTWHTAAYDASVAFGATNTPVAALADNVLKIGSANGFVLQESMMLLAASAVPTNGTGFRLTSPKFSQFNPIEVIPVGGAADVANGLLTAGWPYRPPNFRQQEEVTAFADTGGAAAGQERLVVHLSNGIVPPPGGEELTLKLTSATAATADKWSLLTFSLSQQLPEGLYSLVGSEMFSATGIAHRWTFWGQFYRPGFPSSTAKTNQQWPGVRDYRLGEAGRFSNIVLPGLEVLCSGADAAFTGFIRCIKVA